LKPPKFPKQKIRVYTDDECRKLLEVARQYELKKTPVRWGILIQMCLDTGMRRGELLNTTWCDIDFKGFTVDVSPKKDHVTRWEWHIKDTERRRLPLTAELVKLLAEHKVSQPQDNPYVFVPDARYKGNRNYVMPTSGQLMQDDVLWQVSHLASGGSGTWRRLSLEPCTTCGGPA
jgi:integrase